MISSFNMGSGEFESSHDDHSATQLTVNNIAINIVAYGSLPSQQVVTLDLKLSTATCADDFPAILREILRSGLPLTATIHFFRESAEGHIARQAIASGGTAPTVRLLTHDELIRCYPSLGLSRSGFHLLEAAEGIRTSFLRVEEARQPDSGSRWIVSGPWTFREACTVVEREGRSLPDPRVPEEDGREEEQFEGVGSPPPEEAPASMQQPARSACLQDSDNVSRTAQVPGESVKETRVLGEMRAWLVSFCEQSSSGKIVQILNSFVLDLASVPARLPPRPPPTRTRRPKTFASCTSATSTTSTTSTVHNLRDLTTSVSFSSPRTTDLLLSIMCAAKNRKRNNKGKKASNAPVAVASEPGNASSQPLSAEADNASPAAEAEDRQALADEVHRSQQELLGRLRAENEKADEILRGAQAMQAEMGALRDKLRMSKSSEAHGDASSQPERCSCAIQWPNAERQQLAWLHIVDRELGHRFNPGEHGFFRYLPAPEGQNDDENEVFYRHENTACEICGGARCKVSGPWSRVEAFSLVSRKILGELMTGEISYQDPDNADVRPGGGSAVFSALGTNYKSGDKLSGTGMQWETLAGFCAWDEQRRRALARLDVELRTYVPG
ncbi:uncharacterized protein J3D65DRAFT_656684 [Phyllosticta citribraziliensis]|uniref:Uncharacterized protein n=1 Tax=Phyllosticta citribraziliensis TaxID=989973 RepID=A0ABR1M4J6_9PEZI